MKRDDYIKIFSPVVQEAYDSIPAIDWATDAMTEGIASRIVTIMKQKNISRKELAALTHRRPSDVTRWLGGGHNFTCRTIALIELALGTPLIMITE